ncbi:hypothetical protein FEM08_16080 [Flavobacterium gilvum]|nr:hypothetical protein FEM08_16080 [Flavobacterium gilvum]
MIFDIDTKQNSETQSLNPTKSTYYLIIIPKKSNYYVYLKV